MFSDIAGANNRCLHKSGTLKTWNIYTAKWIKSLFAYHEHSKISKAFYSFRKKKSSTCFLLGIQSITRSLPSSPHCFSTIFLLFRLGEFSFQSSRFPAGDQVPDYLCNDKLRNKLAVTDCWKYIFRSLFFKKLIKTTVRCRREKLRSSTQIFQLRSSLQIFPIFGIFKLPENLILGVWWFKHSFLRYSALFPLISTSAYLVNATFLTEGSTKNPSYSERSSFASVDQNYLWHDTSTVQEPRHISLFISDWRVKRD